MTYAYCPIFSPDEKILVVKSTGGRLAVYSPHSVISFYDTKDFSLKSQIVSDEYTMLREIEWDKNTDEYYVPGFFRDADLIYSSGFVGKLADNKIVDCVAVSEKEYHFYVSFCSIKRMGFTPKYVKWLQYRTDIGAKDSLIYSLAKLYSDRISALINQNKPHI